MNPENTITGVATITDLNGKQVIIACEDLETLQAYLEKQNEVGAPEARKVAIILGPSADYVAPAPAYHAFAARLNGNLMGDEITQKEQADAKKAGLVVVFGYSDDYTLFRGVIRDEAGLGAIRITKSGNILEEDRMDTLNELVEDGTLSGGDSPKFSVIIAKFDDHHHYDTDIPHATFDIMEDGELFCRGIVFSISDLK